MKKSERRKNILNAARKVFAKKGYQATSITDIAEAAGVARATLYIHFKDKRTIFEFLLDELFEVIIKSVKIIDVSEKATLSPMVQMRNNVSSVLHILKDHKSLTKILLSEAVGVDAGFDLKLLDFYSKIAKVIESSLTTGMRMGIIRPLEEKIISRSILGSVKEVMYHYMMMNQEDDINYIIDEIINYNVHGVATKLLLEHLES